MTFLFGVLGSITFWVLFFAVGLFVGSQLIRHFAPKTFKFIKTGEVIYVDSAVAYIIIVFVHLIFWPVILFAVIIGLIISKIFWPLLCKAIRTSLSLVPDIDIEIKKKKGKEN